MAPLVLVCLEPPAELSDVFVSSSVLGVVSCPPPPACHTMSQPPSSPHAAQTAGDSTHGAPPTPLPSPSRRRRHRRAPAEAVSSVSSVPLPPLGPARLGGGGGRARSRGRCRPAIEALSREAAGGESARGREGERGREASGRRTISAVPAVLRRGPVARQPASQQSCSGPPPIGRSSSPPTGLARWGGTTPAGRPTTDHMAPSDSGNTHSKQPGRDGARRRHLLLVAQL